MRLMCLFGLTCLVLSGVFAQKVIVNTNPLAVKGDSIYMLMGKSQSTAPNKAPVETATVLEYVVNSNHQIELKVRPDILATTLTSLLKNATVPRKILMKETRVKDGAIVTVGEEHKILEIKAIEKILTQLQLPLFSKPIINLTNAYEFGPFSVLDIEYRQIKDNEESKYNIFVPSNNDISGMLNAEW